MAEPSAAIIVGRQPLFIEGVTILLQDMRPYLEIHKLDFDAPLSAIAALQAQTIIICCSGVDDKPEILLSKFTNQPEAEYEKIIVFCPLISDSMRKILAESGILVMPLAIEIDTAKSYLLEYLRAGYYQVAYKAAEDRELTPLFLPNFDELTVREKEVLKYISRGYSNADIAETMTIHINTVKVHVQKICRKLAVQNRTEAASNYSRLLNAGYS